MDYQLLYKLILVFLYSFFATRWALPYVMRNLKKYGYMVNDKYKKGTPRVLTMGGLAIMVGVVVSISLSQILLSQESLANLIVFYFIIAIYAMYGLADDLFSFKSRYDKILILLILSFPMASFAHDTIVNLLITQVDLGLFYSLVIIPVYIMVVANLINVHAGYNGLTQGTSLILLIALGIQSYLAHGTTYMIYLMPILGAAIAFYPKTFVPAKILPGNTGDLLIGAAIGAFIVVNSFLWFGIFILIPHIINFLMDTYTLVLKRIPDQKFGKLRKDGTIEAPPTMKYKSLKFLIVCWFRLTERQATLILCGITAIFCVVGLIIF